MYNQIHDILKDHHTGTFTFKAFSLCHIIYLLLIIAAIVLVIYLFKDKSQATKTKVINLTVTIALCLYIADFFLMPFSEGKINIDKLPFHLCTSMSVMCFLARHNKKVAPFKTAFTILGLIGGLMYLTYPSGVAEADGYSYRIIQTVLYHGLMIAQGVFAFAFDDLDLDWKKIYYDAIAIAGLAVWAFIGNTLYSGTNEALSYAHDFNWFFVKHDALYLIDDNHDGLIAPIMSIVSVFGFDALIRLIVISLQRLFKKEAIPVEEN